MLKSYTKAGANVVTLASDDGARDKTTFSFITVGHDLAELYDGNSFHVERLDTDLDTAAKIEMLLVTPNSDTYAHIVIGFFAGKGCTFEFFENTVTTNDGTALVAYNRNRNSDTPATVVATHTPTISNNGTLMQTKYAGSTGKYAVPGEARGANEWILKANTKYLIVLTSHEDDQKCRVYANWHEHKDIT